MVIDPTGLLEAIEHGLSKLPSALVAAALLAGPTAVWLIARFTNPPTIAKPEVPVSDDLHWVCAKCRSINEDRLRQCYRCHLPRTADAEGLIFEPVPARSGIGVAVGPGLPIGPPPSSWLGAEVAGASRPGRGRSDAAGADEAEPPAARPPAPPPAPALEPVFIEPRIKVSSRRAEPAATTPRSRGKAQAGGVEKAKRKTGSPRTNGSRP